MSIRKKRLGNRIGPSALTGLIDVQSDGVKYTQILTYFEREKREWVTARALQTSIRRARIKKKERKETTSQSQFISSRAITMLNRFNCSSSIDFFLSFRSSSPGSFFLLNRLVLVFSFSISLHVYQSRWCADKHSLIKGVEINCSEIIRLTYFHHSWLGHDCLTKFISVSILSTNKWLIILVLKIFLDVKSCSRIVLSVSFRRTITLMMMMMACKSNEKNKEERWSGLVFSQIRNERWWASQRTRECMCCVHIALVNDDYASRDREKERRESRGRERREKKKKKTERQRERKDDEGCLFCSEKSAMKVIHLYVKERQSEEKCLSLSLYLLLLLLFFFCWRINGIFFSSMV